MAVSRAVADIPANPPPEIRFRRRISVRSALHDVWVRRELVAVLAERDFRARYKQAVLGIAWAILNPLILMVVFSVLFRRVAKIDTGGIPYPIFSYIGLLPWTFFSTAVSQAASSLIGNKQLLNKIHCPREVFPIAGVLVAAVDSLIAITMLGALFAIFTFLPQFESYWVLPLFAIQVAFTLAVSLFISISVVYIRDVKQTLSMMLQVGLFATPIAYGMDSLPRSIRGVFSFINPLVPVIDGYRRSVLQGLPPRWNYVALGGVSSILMLAGAYMLFKKLETGIADVA